MLKHEGRPPEEQKGCRWNWSAHSGELQCWFEEITNCSGTLAWKPWEDRVLKVTETKTDRNIARNPTTGMGTI
jgi:hypothetical protein